MPYYFGIDTSNYTTSVAIYDSLKEQIVQSKMLLPVKEGEIGIRQSDAVFHHVKQLPLVIGTLIKENNITLKDFVKVGVSVKPTDIENSYMPCFLCGESFASSLSLVNEVEVFKSSHQKGHVLAALYSAKKLDIIDKKFVAFHVSGGTTDCLLCEPSKEEIIKITHISSSLDLKAGQAIDRIGTKLGLKFPCGKELEKIALKSEKDYKIKPFMRGLDCSISGLENKCMKMIEDNESKYDVAKYCLDYIYSVISEITNRVIKNHGEIHIIYSGGVMSNVIIKNKITEKYKNTFFAEPEFSCDNAAGMAIYAFLMDGKNYE